MLDSVGPHLRFASGPTAVRPSSGLGGFASLSLALVRTLSPRRGRLLDERWAPAPASPLGVGAFLLSQPELLHPLAWKLGGQVFGGLADLPVAIGPGVFEGLVDLGPIECGEGDYGAAADGGLVGRCVEYRGETRLVPNAS